MNKTAKLLHYVHCPYCIRVRMAAGFLKVPYETQVVPYNDEKTPLQLIGKKMLPIWIDGSGKPHPESLDIIQLIDSKNLLQSKTLLTTEVWSELDSYLNNIGIEIHNLAMPYFIYTKEFDEASRIYFQKKKEEKRGLFKNLIQNRNKLESNLFKKLKFLEDKLEPFYKSNEFTILDICLAAHLWGLYVVPEYQFPHWLHNYLRKVKSVCHFNYHEDYWK